MLEGPNYEEIAFWAFFYLTATNVEAFVFIVPAAKGWTSPSPRRHCVIVSASPSSIDAAELIPAIDKVRRGARDALGRSEGFR